MASRSAEQLLADIEAREANVASVRLLLKSINKELGGPEGIARELKRLIQDTDTPSSVKGQALNNILRLHGTYAESDEGALMDRDDLTAEVEALLQRMDQEDE